MIKYKLDTFSNFDRKTNSPITKFLILPIGRLIALFFLNYTNLRPYQITFIGLFLAIISSILFLNSNFIIGSIIFYFSIIFDCVDGYVARIKKNGSAFGIILDGYIDFIKTIITILSIIHALNYDKIIITLFVIFIIINLLDISLNKCRANYLAKQDLFLNKFEIKLIKIKNYLARKGLRTILYYNQEKYFLVFLVGGLTQQFLYCLIINLILSLIFLHLRIFFDLALIKNEIINKTSEELKLRDFV